MRNDSNLMIQLKRMRIFIPIVFCILLFGKDGMAQENDLAPEYKKLAIIMGSQFQNFAMPFRDLESHFTHLGVFVGSEITFNKKRSLFQQATLGAYKNKEMGNGISLSTQFGYRQKIYEGFYIESKIGVGYLYVFHPTQAFRYSNRAWKNVIGGTSQLSIPFDVGFGYTFRTKVGILSPFVTHQINTSLFYNNILPLNFYTHFFIGLRVELFN